MTGPIEEKAEKKLTRSDLKRMAILEAAAEIFSDRGYETTSMDEVAARANVSKRTVYNHFDNKGALFGAIINGECGRALESAHSSMSEDAPPAKALTQFGIDFLNMIYEERAVKFFRSVVAEACRFPELGEIFFQAGVCPAQVGLQDYIGKAMDRGELRKDDPVFAATMYFAMLKSDVHFRLLLGVQKSVSPEEVRTLVTNVVNVWMRAYKPD